MLRGSGVDRARARQRPDHPDVECDHEDNWDGGGRRQIAAKHGWGSTDASSHAGDPRRACRTRRYRHLYSLRRSSSTSSAARSARAWSSCCSRSRSATRPSAEEHHQVLRSVRARCSVTPTWNRAVRGSAAPDRGPVATVGSRGAQLHAELPVACARSPSRAGTVHERDARRSLPGNLARDQARLPASDGRPPRRTFHRYAIGQPTVHPSRTGRDYACPSRPLFSWASRRSAAELAASRPGRRDRAGPRRSS